MKMLKPLVGLLAVAGALYGAWLWFFCRVYVGPDEMAIVNAKTGDALDEGQILAREGQKGIWEKVLGEGRYFFDPIIYDVRIERVTVIPPGKIGVVTSKVGKDLPQGEFLADAGQKGVQRQVLGPGKYRINPVGYQISIEDALIIPIGYVGVVTSLSGEQAPQGAFAGPNQKGVRADVLQPGLYYINPRQYKVDVLEIGQNQVSLLGKQGGQVITKGNLNDANTFVNGYNSAALNQSAANVLMRQQASRADYASKSSSIQYEAQADAQAEGGRGWGSSLSGSKRRQNAPAEQQAPMAPNAQDRSQRASANAPTFIVNQFVEFPSRDGFEISLDMTVEFETMPAMMADVFRRYGDLPAVVEKAIMPQILSISRLKGSAYKATDFIVGEGREKFQGDLTRELEKMLSERGIQIHNALIRHVNVPDQILTPIQQASVAIEQDLTNKERQNTARKQADLNREQAMIEQFGQKVQQETAKMQAEIQADQERQVAGIEAETNKRVAEVGSQTATIRAEMVTKMGQAQAQTVVLVEGERAKGFQMKVDAFGDAQAYALWEFARGLNPNLKVRVIHAGEGTLWTDLDQQGFGALGGAAVLKNQAAPAASPK